MDWGGVFILLAGVWALTLPVVWWLAIRRKRWLLGISYSLPVLWFVGGYVATIV
jgi:hypothetical protein